MLDRPVSEWMTLHPVTVHADAPLLEVKKYFERPDFHHHLPVVEDGRLVGMISLYDFILAVRQASFDDSDPVYAQKRASDVMSRDTVTCSPSTPVAEVVSLLLTNRFHALPVVAGGRLEGIITGHDLLKILAQQGE